MTIDNGAVAELSGSGIAFELTADNGAVVNAGNFAVEMVEIDADNGAVVRVCATDSVTGKVDNGAVPTVSCGADVSGIATSNGAIVN